MDLNCYQRMAMQTAFYPGTGENAGLAYTALGLTGEAGEFANKVKKILRDGNPASHYRESLIAELGDVLWYVAAALHELDATMEQAAGYNLAKLGDRSKRGTLSGSGDNR